MTGPELLGARVELVDTIRPDALLFGESTGRVVIGTDAAAALLELAREHGVPARSVGRVGGDRLVIAPARGTAWIDTAVTELQRSWREALPRRLEGA